MRLVAHTLVFVLAVAIALPIVIGAQATPTTARSETRIQLGDLLFGDQRFWEAIRVYDQAKEGATLEQLVRASTGLIEALLQVAEFTRARQEAEYLHGVAPQDQAALALNGDAQWAAGLFDEAEQVYRDVLVLDPESGRARHGLAKSLATRNQLDEALDWAEAALEVSPDRAAFHHTLGSIYQLMHRFPEAADAYEHYVDLLAADDANTEKANWARAEVRFLRSFGDRPAVQIADQGPHTIPFRLVRDKVIVRGRGWRCYRHWSWSPPAIRAATATTLERSRRNRLQSRLPSCSPMSRRRQASSSTTRTAVRGESTWWRRWALAPPPSTTTPMDLSISTASIAAFCPDLPGWRLGATPC